MRHRLEPLVVLGGHVVRHDVHLRFEPGPGALAGTDGLAPEVRPQLLAALFTRAVHPLGDPEVTPGAIELESTIGGDNLTLYHVTQPIRGDLARLDCAPLRVVLLAGALGALLYW